MRHLIGEYRVGSTFRLIVWGIESLPVVSTAAFRRDLAVPPLVGGPFRGRAAHVRDTKGRRVEANVRLAVWRGPTERSTTS